MRVAPELAREVWRTSIPRGFPPAHLALGPDGLALLKSIETLRLQPYDDQTGGVVDSWVKGATIGYGHLIHIGDWAVYKHGITEDDANTLLASDLMRFESAVRDAITVGLQQYEFDALVLLAFNIGTAHFSGSSIVRLINDPAAITGYPDLESAWKAWNKSQGKAMKGLVQRRESEWKIYTTATYERW